MKNFSIFEFEGSGKLRQINKRRADETLLNWLVPWLHLNIQLCCTLTVVWLLSINLCNYHLRVTKTKIPTRSSTAEMISVFNRTL